MIVLKNTAPRVGLQPGTAVPTRVGLQPDADPLNVVAGVVVGGLPRTVS